MSEDLLKQAKALRSSAFGTHKQALDVVDELIAEVERRRSQSVEQVFRRKNEEIAGLRARIEGLEAEVEASRIRLREFQNHEGQTHAAMEKIVGNSDNFVELTRQMKAEVERLRSVISEPVKSFGTMELVSWVNQLHKTISEYPDAEWGNWPFVLMMGVHCENFSKRWHSPTIELMAARIKELEAEVEAKNKQIKELQDLIDKPPEEADWVADYHLLQSALDDPIIDAARKWHAAHRKAQNSNLMKTKEVERLRAALAHKLDLRNRHIESLEAKIKELKTDRIEAKTQ